MANEIGVRLTGENSEFRSMLNRSVADAEKFSGDLASKVAGKLTGMRDVSTAVATALGINIQNIAENIARFFSGMSKAEEEAFKRLEQVTTQVADTNIKNMRALLTEEQRYQLNLQDREKLIQQIANAETKTAVQLLKQKEAELQLAQKSAEIQQHELKLTEERRKAFEDTVKVQITANEKLFQAQIASLETEQKIAVIKETIVGMQEVLASGVLSENNAKQVTLTLQERKNLLVAEEAKAAEKLAKIQEESRKEEAKFFNEKSKLQFEALKPQEKLLVLAESLATAEQAIFEAKRQGLNTSELEVVALENRKDIAEIQNSLEEDRVRALEAQTEEINRQAKAYEDLMKMVQSFQSVGTSYEGQSTAALQGVRDRIKSQLTQFEQEDFGRGGGVGGKATPIAISSRSCNGN
jgi:hypothetical protein